RRSRDAQLLRRLGNRAPLVELQEGQAAAQERRVVGGIAELAEAEALLGCEVEEGHGSPPGRRQRIAPECGLPFHHTFPVLSWQGQKTSGKPGLRPDNRPSGAERDSSSGPLSSQAPKTQVL